METEKNLYQTAKAEQDSYEQELRLINKAFHELGERHFTLQVCRELHLPVSYFLVDEFRSIINLGSSSPSASVQYM
jgi:hypothetical protein